MKIITPEDAENIVREVADLTHALLAKHTAFRCYDDDYGPMFKHEVDPVQIPYAMGGFCGFASDFAGLLFEDRGVKAQRVAIHDVPLRTYSRHTICVAEIESVAGLKHYLLDKTYRQFELWGFATDPARVLETLPEGPDILGSLFTAGFFEITPQRASSYLASFTKGTPPFSSLDEAMEFLTHPPQPSYPARRRAEYVRQGYIA